MQEGLANFNPLDPVVITEPPPVTALSQPVAPAAPVTTAPVAVVAAPVAPVVVERVVERVVETAPRRDSNLGLQAKDSTASKTRLVFNQMSDRLDQLQNDLVRVHQRVDGVDQRMEVKLEKRDIEHKLDRKEVRYQ